MLNFAKSKIIIFLLILVLGSVLRLSRLESFPVGFHIDEASLGFNGYSFLLTGKDENNNKFPLYIDMFGDQRPSGYHFLTILPIKIFGLSEFSTRLPGVFFGILSIGAIFFLTNSVFGNKNIALLASFLLSISPWHITLSRASAETIVSLFFILSGFALFLTSIRKKSTPYLILASLLLILSFFFYHTPRVFVPTVLFILIVLFFHSLYKNNKKYFKKLILSIIFVGFVSFLLIFIIKGGSGRFTQVNIFASPSTKLIYEEEIKEDGVMGVSTFFSRLSHNKILSYSRTYFSNYFDYFSGNSLFINGGLPIWYKVPNFGLLYIIELPFILIGLFSLLAKRNIYGSFLIFWVLASPLTAALTTDDIPNIQRSIVLFPILETIAAYGMYIFYTKFKNFQKQILLILFILFSFNGYYFLHQYFIHSKVHKTWYRNNGFKEMVETVNKSYASYDSIVVTKTTGGIYPLVLFYTKYDPAKYQRENSPKDKDYKGFGKFVFVPQDCPSVNRDDRFPKGKRTIFIDRGNCPSPKVVNPNQHTSFVLREDGTKAFRIVYETI